MLMPARWILNLELYCFRAEEHGSKFIHASICITMLLISLLFKWAKYFWTNSDFSWKLVKIFILYFIKYLLVWIVVLSEWNLQTLETAGLFSNYYSKVMTGILVIGSLLWQWDIIFILYFCVTMVHGVIHVKFYVKAPVFVIYNKGNLKITFIVSYFLVKYLCVLPSTLIISYY